MRPFFFCLLFIFFFLFNCKLHAQEQPKDFVFNSNLKACQMSFTPNNKFTEFEGAHNYSCGDDVRYNALFYTMVNKDSSIVIGFTLMKATPKHMQAMLGPKADFNTNYIKNAKYLADTINHKLIFYKPTYIKQKFNADDVVEYYRACLTPYNGKYPFKKVVIGVKRDIGQFEIIYFYTKAAEKNIDKVIKNTAGIIKYNEL